MANTHDLIVIGAGPGGYVAAIRAAQLGLDTACIDREEVLGGTCLRIGCIPSKALLESSERYEEAKNRLVDHGVRVGEVELDLPTMLARKNQIVNNLTRGVSGLFKKNKITFYHGQAKFTGPRKLAVFQGGNKTADLEAAHVIIATGSVPASLPGVDLKATRIDTSTDALAYKEVPKHLAVIGAGYIGLELGSVWRRLGAKVTVVEYLDRILPGMDSEIAREAKKMFEKQGLLFELKSRVTGVDSNDDGVVIKRKDGAPIEADRVLVAVGRAPATANLGLAAAGISVDDRGFIPIKQGFRTSIEGVYAIGDIIRTPMLAHVAEEEGIACVEEIVNGVGHVNYNAIPAVVYTYPEIASCGKTEDDLKDEAIDYRVGQFFFRGNGRAYALNETEGKVKVLAHKKTDRVLGVHIIGPRAGDLIAECAAAMEFGATAEDIARTCHAHPTLSEAVKEAALAVDGRTIHA